MKLSRFFSTFILLFILTGCASGYSRFYNQRINENEVKYLETLKDGQNPVIVKTDNIGQEIDRYFAKNYKIIGVSAFNGPMESDENFINHAIDVKATLVLQSSRFTNSQLVSTPLFTPNGFGGINTTAMHSQQMRYHQEAVFMAKNAKLPRFGIYLIDLTPNQRKKFERNSGAIVRVVNEGTPAFYSNIIPDDLIIAIDGDAVIGAEHLGQMLANVPLSANKVVFTIIRNNIEMDIIVNLEKKNPSQDILYL